MIGTEIVDIKRVWHFICIRLDALLCGFFRAVISKAVVKDTIPKTVGRMVTGQCYVSLTTPESIFCVKLFERDL